MAPIAKFDDANLQTLSDILGAMDTGLAGSENVLAFVTHVMNPVRHVGNPDYFETETGKLNSVLAFSGMMLAQERMT